MLFTKFWHLVTFLVIFFKVSVIVLQLAQDIVSLLEEASSLIHVICDTCHTYNYTHCEECNRQLETVESNQKW